MRKYLPVIKITLSQEFAYRANFIMWRVRNIIQIFLIFFLWDAIYSGNNTHLFGYSTEQMFTYIIGLVIVKAVVMSTRARDVAREISDGTLSFYLTKPVNYIKYYLAKDVSTKLLNFTFSIFETFLLIYVFNPTIFIQTNPLIIAYFIISLILGAAIYFFIAFIVSCIPFWKPEMAWGGHFVITYILVEFLSGAYFPLDILPKSFQKVLELFPFQYLIYFPLKIYLGEMGMESIIKGIVVTLIWVVILYMLLKKIWEKGMVAYEGHGQ